MMRNKFLNIFLIFFGLFLYSCQTASEALQGKKRSDQSDEFLVEKKNPLAMPPGALLKDFFSQLKIHHFDQIAFCLAGLLKQFDMSIKTIQKKLKKCLKIYFSSFDL